VLGEAMVNTVDRHVQRQSEIPFETENVVGRDKRPLTVWNESA
jgi:hypothetical protein